MGIQSNDLVLEKGHALSLSEFVAFVYLNGNISDRKRFQSIVKQVNERIDGKPIWKQSPNVSPNHHQTEHLKSLLTAQLHYNRVLSERLVFWQSELNRLIHERNEIVSDTFSSQT
ncbi:hypothetical protein ACOME3_003953 [Neoechinorhynchus agilis]